MTPTDRAALPGMVGEHPTMLEVYALARRIAPTKHPVPIVGDTGTGKEVVARAVHSLSEARLGPFVDINCAAIPENLVEGELFGWEKHAFTGAHSAKPGLLELADGGTLFLDEACALPRAVQGKLLRALEMGEHRRIGGRQNIRSTYRVILALQVPLRDLIQDGRYLPAFAHRVNGLQLHLPAISSRGSDVRLLALHFLKEENDLSGRDFQLSESALGALERHHWTGNVRELKKFIEQLPLVARSNPADADDVAQCLALLRTREPSNEDLLQALDQASGNESQAARRLGIARTSLRDRLARIRERPDVRQALV